MELPNLKIDFTLMEGSISIPASFKELSWVSRADLLQDWIGDLIAVYNETINEPGNSGA